MNIRYSRKYRKRVQVAWTLDIVENTEREFRVAWALDIVENTERKSKWYEH